MESLPDELCSHPFTFVSFTQFQLHTSVSQALSLVPSSTEPPCLKFPSQPNLVCLHPLFFKVSSQNTCLIKSISPSPSTDSIKETDKKQTTPCRSTKAWKWAECKCSSFLSSIPSLFDLFCLSRLIVNCPSAVSYLGCEFPRAEPSF